MTLTETLLERILAYCAAKNMTERQFGLTVANNHKLTSRLRTGFGVNSQTHDRIIAFIEGKQPIPLQRKSKRRTPAANDAPSKPKRRPAADTSSASANAA